MDSSPSEEQQQQRREEDPDKECVHKTKPVQFFSRVTPIILQNENGPCPLLAICNVLLLKNQLNLSADMNEVSQEKLLSLVAERLIDSNSNVNNKDAGYVQNQEQNIADAIDLLPRLTTGIDVNIKFRRIDDFEFTRECAIFDLLDIPLYHGWLVDPQDYETAKTIGSKSYNTLTRDLVSLREKEGKGKNKSEEDSIDFVAATTATLGVPSPCLSRAMSFDDSPRSASPKVRKGDAEEEAELLRALKLSETLSSAEESGSVAAGTHGQNLTANSDEHLQKMISTPASSLDMLEGHDHQENHAEPCVFGEESLRDSKSGDITLLERPAEQSDLLSSKDHINQPGVIHQEEGFLVNKLTITDTGVAVEDEDKPSPSLDINSTSKHENAVLIHCPPAPDLLDETPKETQEQGLQVQSTPDEKCKLSETENPMAVSSDSGSSSGNAPIIEPSESFTSSLNDSEPIYEGEECIMDTTVIAGENREPVYEGEVVLAEQADGSTVIDSCDIGSKDEITPQEGELISNFLKNNASQLTFHGLFSLQEGLKERELCVFFRNNHFSTMFKFEGHLYLLVTDQGYLNQPNLVWEKLNEVNGDTLFVTSDFKEFKLDSQSDGTWDMQNAVASTADYLASIEKGGQDGSNINSDLQLAIALQQQEFEQQPQRHTQTQQPQPAATTPVGASRLITGPQRTSARPTTSAVPPKQDRKSKDGCSIM